MKKQIITVVCSLLFSSYIFAQDAQQALVEAVQAKNFEAVKKVVEQLNADVNKPWDEKAAGKPYALHIAYKTLGGPPVEIIKYLLDKGADVNVEDKFGVTPLMYLVRLGDTTNRVAVFNLLVEKGADINETSGGGVSVLGYACEGSNIEIVKLLLAKGADVDGRKNNFANTPLMSAVMVFGGLVNNQNETIIDLLLAAGADPKEEKKVATKAGTFDIKTAADIAREKGFTALADKLANAKKVKVKKK